MKLLTSYINGNYKVFLFDDGTKYRVTLKKDDKEFLPDFPENIDVKLTNRCDIGCPFCHENSSPCGKDYNPDTLNRFINSLRPGMELAIGGGSLGLLYSKGPFFWLIDLIKKGVCPSITINQKELEMDNSFYSFLTMSMEESWIYGLGISFIRQDEKLKQLCKDFQDNIVIHTINGITSPEDYLYLAKNHFKVLVLGYKDFRRGHSYKEVANENIKKNQEWLSNNILKIAKDFKTLSFDNLAIEQLNMKEKVSSETWDKYYMGDDGTHTMYVDLVSETFALSSTVPEEERHPLPKGDYDISDLFKVIQEDKRKLDARITD